MFPYNDYILIHRRQEEMLQQAKLERVLQVAKLQQPGNRDFHRKSAAWLGTHLVRLGQKLKRFGTPGKPRPSPSPHY
jgi:hypothetical protein